MKIFKSDDLKRWSEIMASDFDGTKFHMINPRTGEVDQVFEFNRTAPQILEGNNVCEREMFDYIWEMQENFSKVEDANREICIKYDLCKLECQNMMKYFHLNLPKNESGKSRVRLKDWKKYRSKDIIWQEFVADTERNTSRVRVDSFAYYMKNVLTNGTINIGAAMDMLSRPDFNAMMNLGTPVKNPNFVNEKDR